MSEQETHLGKTSLERSIPEGLIIVDDFPCLSQELLKQGNKKREASTSLKSGESVPISNDAQEVDPSSSIGGLLGLNSGINGKEIISEFGKAPDASNLLDTRTQLAHKGKKNADARQILKKEWAGLFKDNRAPTLGAELYEVRSNGKKGNCEIDIGDLLPTKTAWGHTLIGYFAGNKPGNWNISNMKRSWGVKVDHHEHHSGWHIFQFVEEAEMIRVLEGGPYFASQQPLIMKPIPELFRFEDEVMKYMPVWITLPCLPKECWGTQAMSTIVSQVGKPVRMDRRTHKLNAISYARALVIVDASLEQMNQVTVTIKGKSSFVQDIHYDFTPKFCTRCKCIGHLESVCLNRKVDNVGNHNLLPNGDLHADGETGLSVHCDANVVVKDATSFDAGLSENMVVPIVDTVLIDDTVLVDSPSKIDDVCPVSNEEGNICDDKEREEQGEKNSDVETKEIASDVRLNANDSANDVAFENSNHLIDNSNAACVEVNKVLETNVLGDVAVNEKSIACDIGDVTKQSDSSTKLEGAQDKINEVHDNESCDNKRSEKHGDESCDEESNEGSQENDSQDQDDQTSTGYNTDCECEQCQAVRQEAGNEETVNEEEVNEEEVNEKERNEEAENDEFVNEEPVNNEAVNEDENIGNKNDESNSVTYDVNQVGVVSVNHTNLVTSNDENENEFQSVIRKNNGKKVEPTSQGQRYPIRNRMANPENSSGERSYYSGGRTTRGGRGDYRGRGGRSRENNLLAGGGRC